MLYSEHNTSREQGFHYDSKDTVHDLSLMTTVDNAP